MAGMLALTALPLPAPAQDARGPLRLIVPQPPGGAADFIARILADGMGRELGQAVVVENRGGANGTIAVNALKASRNDGTAVLLGGVSLFAFNPSLYSNLPYDPFRDFTYVAPVVDTVLVLVANPRLGVGTLADLMDRARAQPERLTYASVGIGNSTHLAMEMITGTAGVRMTHVPFTGSTPAVTSVLTAQTDCMVIPLQTVIPHIGTGALVPLAVMNSGRVATMPDVPALRETGFESLAMPGWYALVGPAGMPDAVTERLNAAVRATVMNPDAARRLREQALEPMTATAAEVRRAVETDSANWGAFIRRTNLKVE
ncbi:Bug family tripartite tricarboxylate transporter substrate binding protein [Roseomonas sp. CCTCC AB2023176]|uniref:Bug family tripartite tricarboxylate transporter substrate binding protein n=1 Tax=Roseomonas sp. CCTCC AB2023176 TaxID=3342640 RepID=UPI0035DDDACF